ncbi:dephospho-CoA kinase [Paenibacillus sp. GCM10027626]|uniref:dephospho-CoA kinase n=1 Tax=Paenibacillus sp. GCM10027626 TaxID=3273411 RepID=UPI00362B2E6E
MILGLTGGIASGKSTVSTMLAELGAKLVDADQVAREVVLPGEPALAELVERFGSAILHEDGTLNRAALGQIVFTPDKGKLKELEAIMHPAIRKRMQQQIKAYAAASPKSLIVADIPLLYETGQAEQYEAVMVVYVPRAVQIERLMARQGITREEAEMRIDLQMDMEEKKRKADYLIDNSGTLEQTRQQVEQFWQGKGFS